MSRADTAIRAAAGVTVVGLAGIAAAISYSHMTELAHAHGETGWRAHMFPLSVDGIEIVASLVLLADKRAARRSGSLPWAALIVGTGASFAANVAVGGTDLIGRAISGWPAFALLVTIKLLFSLFDHPTGPAPAETTTAAATPDTAGNHAHPPGNASPPAAPDTTSPEQPKTTHDDRAGSPAHGACSHRPDRPTPRPQAAATSRALDVSALLPTARAARDALAARGQRITRAGLARQMRADGHPVSSARASLLLKMLATESAQHTSEPASTRPRAHAATAPATS